MVVSLHWTSKLLTIDASSWVTSCPAVYATVNQDLCNHWDKPISSSPIPPVQVPSRVTNFPAVLIIVVMVLLQMGLGLLCPLAAMVFIDFSTNWRNSSSVIVPASFRSWRSVNRAYAITPTAVSLHSLLWQTGWFLGCKLRLAPNSKQIGNRHTSNSKSIFINSAYIFPILLSESPLLFAYCVELFCSDRLQLWAQINQHLKHKSYL